MAFSLKPSDLFGEETNQVWTRGGLIIILGSFFGGALGISLQFTDWRFALCGVIVGLAMMRNGERLAVLRYQITETVRAKAELEAETATRKEGPRTPMNRSTIEDAFMGALRQREFTIQDIREVKLPGNAVRQEVLSSVLAKLQVYRGRLSWDGDKYVVLNMDQTRWTGNGES